MITKQLGKITFAWEPSAFKGRGYWFVLGKNGGLGRAASKKESTTLKVPKEQNQKQEKEKEKEPPQPTSRPTVSPVDNKKQSNNTKQPLISTKTFNSLQDIKTGDTLSNALSKLYTLFKVEIESEHEQEEIDALFEEEREQLKEKWHKELLEAILPKRKPAEVKSRQQRRAEERKQKKEETKAAKKEEKAEAKKAEEPKKAEAKKVEAKKAEEPKKVEAKKAEEPKKAAEKAPEKTVEKPKAEKVEKEVAPKKEVEPPKKAEAIPEKPPTPTPKPAAEPVIPKTSAPSKVAEIGKAAIGAAAIVGLGSASAKFESSGDPSTVSSGMMGGGKKDPGGISYGTYQMSSTMGVADDFVKKSEWKKEFDGLKAGTPEFGEKWKQLAKDPKEGKKFADAQHDYIKKTHYDPAAKKAEKMGFKITDAGVADAIWSLSVQHGNVQKVLDIAKKDMGGFVSDDPKKEIEALYQARNEYTDGKFSKRYESEVKVVLGKSTGQQLDSASSENKDLKSQSGNGTTIVNNNNTVVAQGGKQETVTTKKSNDKPIMFQGQ